MPTNPLPSRPALLMRVWSEPYEVEWRCKNICHNLEAFESATAYDRYKYFPAVCPECGEKMCNEQGDRVFNNNGTGTRHVRLVGWVEPDAIHEFTIQDGTDLVAEFTIDIHWGFHSFRDMSAPSYHRGAGPSIHAAMYEITAKLTAAYRNNTLPAEIAAGLEEVEVEPEGMTIRQFPPEAFEPTLDGETHREEPGR